MLGVFPPRRGWLSGRVDDARCSSEWASAAAEATRAWLDEVSADHEWNERYSLASGRFPNEVALGAKRIGADLVAIPPSTEDPESVADLAYASRLPVLVDRPESTGRSILAATNLDPESCAVLHVASDFGPRLHVPVVAFHNSPFGPDPADVAPSFLRFTAMDTGSDAEAQLARAARQQSVSTTVLARERCPVEGIVRQARASAAGIVVVGVRHRNWLGYLLGSSVAARVASRCSASILVVPLGVGALDGKDDWRSRHA